MDKKITIHDAYKRRLKPDSIIHNHPSGISVIFGSTKIDEIENINHNAFLQIITHLKHNNNYHDFMIIDSASNFSKGFFHNIKIADETIVITENNPISLHEAKKTIHHCDENSAEVIGLIINLHGSHKKKLDINKIQRELKKPILGIIPTDKKVHKSLHLGHPVVCSYPNSKISKAFMQIGKKFSDLNNFSKR